LWPVSPIGRPPKQVEQLRPCSYSSWHRLGGRTQSRASPPKKVSSWTSGADRRTAADHQKQTLRVRRDPSCIRTSSRLRQRASWMSLLRRQLRAKAIDAGPVSRRICRRKVGGRRARYRSVGFSTRRSWDRAQFTFCNYGCVARAGQTILLAWRR